MSNNTPTTAVVKFDPKKGGMQIATMEDAMEFGRKVIASGMAPRGVTKPEQVVIAVQVGAELGFSPMQALANIPVINGRASIMGDAAKARIKSKGMLCPGTDFREWITGEGDEMVAHVTSQRVGHEKEFPPHTFSVEDAKVAGLWGKAGPWKLYPKRQLKYRALGFHVRDHYSDVLTGVYLFEEARDIPAAEANPEMTPTGPDPLLDGAPGEEIPDAEVVEKSEPVPEGLACQCSCGCRVESMVSPEDTERIGCLRCSDCYPTPKRFNLEKHSDMADDASLELTKAPHITVGMMREKMEGQA